MIQINRHLFDNGIRLVHSRDAMTRMVGLDFLYDVGSRDEVEGKTGLAHLVEHLMFAGSANAHNFDAALQAAGGISNGGTGADTTCYYEILPAQNIETAFWLESDRLMKPEFNPKHVDLQRNVVLEEFKQNYLNSPYGDVGMLINKSAYTVHPYRHSTIGDSFDEVASLTVDDVERFFYSHYAPQNLVIAVTGNVDFDSVVELIERWFGSIPRRDVSMRSLPMEPTQTSFRQLCFKKTVPDDLIIELYHTCSRTHKDFYATDLISDVLSNGTSSRLIRMVLNSHLFTSVGAVITGTVDPGLMIIEGKSAPGVSVDRACEALKSEIDGLLKNGISAEELQRCVNKREAEICFESMSYLEKAKNLASMELISMDLNLEIAKYRSVTVDDANRVANEIFTDDNRTELIYGPDA
jgi:zinc protease